MDQSGQIDDIDRRLLAAVQHDASASHAALADQVGASAASVWRRIRALEAAGVLGATVRLVDPATIGLGVTVLCNVRVRNHNREVRASFEAFVRARDEIVECFSMSGDWDYLLRVVARDVGDYEYFLMRVLLEHPAVGGASSHFALSTTKYTTVLPVDRVAGR